MKTRLIAALVVTLPAAALAQADATQARIDSSFAAMDGNKDGRIDKAEFTRFVQARQSRQAQELDAAFRAMDKNGDGQLSKAEAASNPIVASNFDALDADHNGSLSNAEMRSALVQAQALEAAR